MWEGLRNVKKTDLTPEVGTDRMTESVMLIMMRAMNNHESHYIGHVPVSVWRDDRDEYKDLYYEMTRSMR
jgi:hypothetical protein